MRTKIRKTKKKLYLNALDLMPTDPQLIKTLEARALQISAIENQKKEQEKNRVAYIQFRLNDELYGIPYFNAKEVMQYVVPNPIPSAPSYIAGVINRRGALLAVFDLKKLFNLKISTYDKTAQIILINAKGLTVGFLADQIVGSSSYDPIELKTSVISSLIKPDYILGLDKGINAIINIENLLGDVQI